MRRESCEHLRVTGLAKAFGSTEALRSCTLAVEAGQVHTVVGENGSGKSTLVKILTGVVAPDRGKIEIGGRSVSSLRSPRAAIAAGIVGVFQNVMVVGSQPVLDNLWLGSDGFLRARIPARVKRARGAELLDRLGVAVDLDAPAESLSLSERQACVVARALLREPEVLILDEATSALDVTVRDRLFVQLRRLADAGRSIVFISHRMDEVEAISDAVTVLRAGATVATVRRGEATAEELVRLMIGAERTAMLRARAASPREPVLVGRDLVLRPAAAPVDLAIRAGELVGVAGLEGHGQEQLLHALAGNKPIRGRIVADGAAIRSRKDAAGHGIVYLPRDRERSSVFESLSIRDNFALPTLPQDRRAGLLSASKTDRRFGLYATRLRIRLGSARDEITTLSGGNQQKVLLARWLAVRPRVLVLNDPTRGIDPGTKRDLYELLSELSGDGVSVVMLSTDVDELVEVMDRVLVFREGTLVAELADRRLTRESLVSAFFGRQ